MSAPVSPSGRGPLARGPLAGDPLDHGALAAAVRAGTPLLGTFIGGASPVAAAARRLEQGWSFVGIGSDSALLAAAVAAEFGRARCVSKPQ
ncbi:MAG TPA: hypothetical protein VFQ68_41060 [Streptosporangiaceae bacterium]|nr:hypothetical protein [Streptosporangiaceae bacterium]